MPSNNPKRTLRCANCKSTEFVQQQIATVRTPVDVTRKGQKIVAVATPEAQVVTNQRDIQILCANCNKPLPGVTPDRQITERLMQASDWERALLAMHFYLWPEDYPPELRSAHDGWHEDMDCFEWSSDTIENVGSMIIEGLCRHSTVPFGDSTKRERESALARRRRELGA